MLHTLDLAELVPAFGVHFVGRFAFPNFQGIENLVVEFNPPTNSLGQQEEDLLHLDAGFRKKKGLRDDIDAADHLWMSIGKAQVAMPRGSSSHNIRQKDINALSQLGCDVEVLRQPGPKRDQVRRLCEVLKEGGVAQSPSIHVQYSRVKGTVVGMQARHIGTSRDGKRLELELLFVIVMKEKI